MKGYDFEVLVDEINNNKLEAQKRTLQEQKKQKRYRLRSWVKVVLWTIFVVFATISIYQIFTVKTIHSTPVGSYTCHGKLFKICGGSREVAEYMGV